jgi:hypothetical protein
MFLVPLKNFKLAGSFLIKSFSTFPPEIEYLSIDPERTRTIFLSLNLFKSIAMFPFKVAAPVLLSNLGMIHLPI